jgi:hypothetical protein
VEEAARSLTATIPGVQESYPVGKRPQIFKMLFCGPQQMRTWLNSIREPTMEWEGRRLGHTLEEDM